jgi:hypothetical protein
MAQITWRSRKRPNFFAGQLLDDDDFKAEQDCHLAQQRRHAANFHGAGVIGLEVEAQGDRTVLIRPGLAIDRLGREIVLDTAQLLSLADVAPGPPVYLTIEYHEGVEDSDLEGEDAASYGRTTEFAILQTAPVRPADDAPAVSLARVEVDAAGRITGIDMGVRRAAGSRIAVRGVGTEHLADASITKDKLHPTLRTGWVRLPFKPSPFTEGGELARTFVIGVTRTYCDAKGAKGTMGIPIPPCMTRLKTLVLAGPRNDAGLDIGLYRCGWDPARNAREEEVLERALPGARATAFCATIAVNWTLDWSHALAIHLHAKGDAEIALVAAEFE